MRYFSNVLRSAGALAMPQSVLDAGAGDGWFLRQLLELLPPGTSAIAWDKEYPSSLVSEPSEGCSPLRFTRHRPVSRFGLVLLLDVLEHVPDDGTFVSTLVEQNLEERAWLFVSVPVWSTLFGPHDRALGHHRRYHPSQCRRLLERAGLHISQSGGAFHSLTAFRLIQKLWTSARGENDQTQVSKLEWRRGRLITELVETALSVDNAISWWAARRGLRLPGLSWWALCRKR